IDRFYFMPPSSAWVFFEDGAPSFPHRMEPHALLQLPMGDHAGLTTSRPEFTLQLVLEAKTSGGDRLKSAPFGGTLLTDRAPQRLDGQAAKFYGPGLRHVVEDLCGVSPDAARAMLTMVNTRALTLAAVISLAISADEKSWPQKRHMFDDVMSGNLHDSLNEELSRLGNPSREALIETIVSYGMAHAAMDPLPAVRDARTQPRGETTFQPSQSETESGKGTSSNPGAHDS
ncbi:MAG: hypothetical protein ACRCYU_06755, partial [Nocardioides sp.]